MRPLALAAALGLLAASSAASASTITITFSGTIEEIGPDVASGFTAGDPFSGSIQFDGATPDSNASAILGDYSGAIGAMSFDFGGYLATATFGQVSVRNDSNDSFNAVTFNGNGAQVNGLTLVSLSLSLVDSGGATFSSDAIPASLSLSNFFFAKGAIEFEGGTTRRVRGSISSLTYTVPEPGALVLLALGGAALAALRRRSWPVRPLPASIALLVALLGSGRRSGDAHGELDRSRHVRRLCVVFHVHGGRCRVRHVPDRDDDARLRLRVRITADATLSGT